MFFSHPDFSSVYNPTNAYPRKLENDNVFGGNLSLLGVTWMVSQHWKWQKKCSPKLGSPYIAGWLPGETDTIHRSWGQQQKTKDGRIGKYEIIFTRIL